MHNRKLIHRKLTADNIFLTYRGDCKIGDFGKTKHLNITKDKCNTRIGIEKYMPPEIFNDEGYDWYADIWTLGVLFYYMATF